jgi:hypothetical protein
MLTERVLERLTILWRRLAAARQKPDPVDLARRLRLSRERPGEDSGQRGQQEAAAVHHSIT